MFRKPRQNSSPTAILGQPPPAARTPASSTAAPPQNDDSSPAIKKQKTAHSTPSFSRPKPPKQSRLTAASFTASPASSSAKKNASVKKKSKGKNASILSFFKPVGKDKVGQVAGAENDDLFIRHGGYGLDVSDPEESEDEDAEMGPFGDSEDEVVDMATASVTEVAKPAVQATDLRTAEDARVNTLTPRAEEAMKECTPPPSPLPSPPLSTGTDAEAPKLTPLKFGTGLLKLDLSRSMLFGNKLPTPKSSMKAEEEISASPTEAGEDATQSNGKQLEETTSEITNPGVAGTDVENGRAAKQDLKTTNGSVEQRAIVDGDDVEVDGEGEESGSGTRASVFNDDEFDDIDDFQDDEVPWEVREGNFDFDPAARDAARGLEYGFGDWAETFGDNVEIVEKPADENEGSGSVRTECEELKCPICQASLGTLSEADANNHVNHCLDGNPIPLPAEEPSASSRHFMQQTKAQKPATKLSHPSAFTKLMSTNTEAQAWAAAAKSEETSRGKRAVDRNCPFYKILFDGPITVDAFLYGAVPGCNAYFLSHFHSDHYRGLTARWCHGPIWCSRVTANLVRTKLGVDPQYVCELPWEEWVEVPNTGGVKVRGLDANHCPGSMLFLFERGLPGKAARKQKILHCGDFRAEPKHLNHPLLRPGKDRQRIDICYLDTTYLNPRYAFPSQGSVIDACAEMCVSLNKDSVNKSDPYESTRNRGGVNKFVKGSNSIVGNGDDSKKRGRLLVVIGTYSIGKERVALGIAKALKSKIYAHPSKMKILDCLEDPELNTLLTPKSSDAQVHMTPLQEIRAETLKEYLDDFPAFDRVVGFRPSGWTYKPPNSRLTDSPRLSDVLYSQSWKSQYTMQELTQQQQRGSTSVTKCFAVPYSEHSSFRELSMFCCALEIGRIIPTVNVGSAKSRQRMKDWIEKWETEKRKNGLFFLGQGGGIW